MWPTYRRGEWVCADNERRVADHVRRCEVAHDELILALLDELGNLVGDALYAHLGVFVVGRNLW